MPMITTTIRSSISVKPLRFIWTTSQGETFDSGSSNYSDATCYSGVSRGTKCALAEGRDRKINLERELHQRQPATTSAKKPQTSRFLQAFRVHAGLGPYPANGRKVHYTASFPPNRSGGVSPPAPMRHAMGLTRTSARLPCLEGRRAPV